MTYLKYLKYKNKYLMLKNMIGGKYDIKYLEAYKPTKLEKINYKIIDDGLKYSYWNQGVGEMDTEELDDTNVKLWAEQIFSKKDNDFNNFFDQLFTMDNNFFELVKKVVIFGMGLSGKIIPPDIKETIKNIHTKFKIEEGKITEEDKQKKLKIVEENIKKKKMNSINF